MSKSSPASFLPRRTYLCVSPMLNGPCRSSLMPSRSPLQSFRGSTSPSPCPPWLPVCSTLATTLAASALPCSASSVRALCSSSRGPHLLLTSFYLLNPAMAIMVYALITFHWRATAIRNKGSGPYDDRLGMWPIRTSAHRCSSAHPFRSSLVRPNCPIRPLAHRRPGQLHPPFPGQQLILHPASIQSRRLLSLPTVTFMYGSMFYTI